MLKNKLIAAGILSVSALAFGVPAMAGGPCANNYRGRYACSIDDGTGAISTTNDLGGVTGTYVVEPNGYGGYYGGELIANGSILWGNNPCTFTLETSGEYVSAYWVDWAGVAYETLYWVDDSEDACAGDYFTLIAESGLSLPNAFAAANSTKVTSNVVVDDYSFAGTGTCNSSAN
jgi:hypothetical protein